MPTISSRLGKGRFIAGQVISHSEGTVTARFYDKSDYLREKRDALNAWAALLGEIVGASEPPSNVVPLRA